MSIIGYLEAHWKRRNCKRVVEIQYLLKKHNLDLLFFTNLCENLQRHQSKHLIGHFSIIQETMTSVTPRSRDDSATHK